LKRLWRTLLVSVRVDRASSSSSSSYDSSDMLPSGGGGRSHGLRLGPAWLLLLPVDAWDEDDEDEDGGAEGGVLRLDEDGVGVVDDDREE
jgi:hypothetical protein